MRLFKIFIIGILALITINVTNTRAEHDDLIEVMKSGGHILMLRHADAPGSGDPANFKIGDCTTQRNLDVHGRSHARAIGEWLRSKGIKDAKVYSSQWCRCRETATLLGFGPVTELPALNSFYGRPENRDPNIKTLQSFIATLPADGKLIIFVTHFTTILEITGEGLSPGEGVVLKLKEGGAYDVLGSLSFQP